MLKVWKPGDMYKEMDLLMGSVAIGNIFPSFFETVNCFLL